MSDICQLPKPPDHPIGGLCKSEVYLEDHPTDGVTALWLNFAGEIWALMLLPFDFVWTPTDGRGVKSGMSVPKVMAMSVHSLGAWTQASRQGWNAAMSPSLLQAEPAKRNLSP